MFDIASHWIFPVHAVSPAGPLPADAERMAFDGPSGDRLEGVHVPPSKGKSGRYLVLAFGGNAWNAQDVAEYLHQVFDEADIVSFYYRGYAPSRGSPSADALIADAPAVYDFVVDRLHPGKILLVGLSIGSGIAATLATQRESAGAILVTPFDSLRAVAQSALPWIPLGPFFGHEIDSADALADSAVPVAILAGERDEIVPAERTDALRRRLRNLVFDRTIECAGHNDIYARSAFQLALREAGDRLIS